MGCFFFSYLSFISCLGDQGGQENWKKYNLLCYKSAYNLCEITSLVNKDNRKLKKKKIYNDAAELEVSNVKVVVEEREWG